ncbi:hypothetical protein Z046_12125 [Pseudomonas aeruginosa VRFPA09]|nr:hypothetical protein Z046_12125 [Pseudomonas aeruginosa VRFPA09]
MAGLYTRSYMSLVGLQFRLSIAIFLMEFQTDDAEALKKLRGAEPFLVTKSPNAVREIHGDRADLYVTDTIYKYRSQGFFIIEGRLVPIRFNLKATMP